MSGGEVSPAVLPDVYSWSTLAQLNYLKKTPVLLVDHSPLQGTGSLDSVHFSVDHATARVTMTSLLVYIRFAVAISALVSLAYCQEADISKCGSSGQKLKYIWGDALTDDPNCIGLNNQPYPAAHIARNFKKSNPWGLSARTGRASYTIDPYTTQRALLRSYEMTHHLTTSNRTSREMRAESCGAAPTRVCQTRYNTTAPLYGISLTSGQPVTIVQKFPDLLQQVIYEVCETKECEVIRGECTQTYVPYLFLVIPLGPVTLTGQDYVLVESGCVCKPKKSTHLNTVP